MNDLIRRLQFVAMHLQNAANKCDDAIKEAFIEDTKACVEAIEVLGRFMPVRPDYASDVRGLRLKCGACGENLYVIADTVTADVIQDLVRYCKRCGRPIDWNGQVEDQEEMMKDGAIL